ncbi:conserved hypothetical protein [Stigmatella aurantiaca DW4/3-1]|uniref:Uncharacterized protein n=1 Tax=Stigmatella aurantiaca (strain DW4/3-1) TaxID=378806 RepID=Q08Z31_STIAD|nr:conserved hypothetical protein [Stigmatella aurantiaca DW4/3-1]
MHHAQHRRHVDEPVQALPGGKAQAPHGRVRGRQRQGHQQHQRDEPHGDEAPLGDVLEDAAQRQPLVHHRVREEVQHRVGEGHEPQHLSQPQGPRPREEQLERRTRQGHQEEHQRQEPGLVEHHLDDVGSQFALQPLHEQQRQRTQAPHQDGGLEPGKRGGGHGSVVLAQVHARIEGGDLLRVAVEGQRGTAAELPNAPLGGLAPARVIHRRVHVRVEAVLVGRREVPRGGRLTLGERDADDGFDALEAVLPRHHQPQGRAVLGRQRLAIEPRGQQGERVDRLVQAQPFHIGPVQHAALLTGHLLRVLQGGEGHVLRTARGLHALDQLPQRDAQPGDDHGPGLHAAHPVDALLRREPGEELVDVHRLRLVHLAVHDDGPGPRLERMGVLDRIPLVEPELIEVVVGGDVVVGRLRLVRVVRPQGFLGDRRLIRGRLGGPCLASCFGRGRCFAGPGALGAQQVEASSHGRGRPEKEARVLDELAAPPVERLGGHFGLRGLRRLLVGHGSLPYAAGRASVTEARASFMRHSAHQGVEGDSWCSQW